MADYETIHVHPDVHERFVALVNEHTPTDKKTEGMRYVLDAAERGFEAAADDDAPTTVSLEAGEVKRIGDELEGRLR